VGLEINDPLAKSLAEIQTELESLRTRVNELEAERQQAINEVRSA